MKCIVHAVKGMQSVPSTESSFSVLTVQTSRVTGRLLSSESSSNLTFPNRTETVSLLVARTERNGELPVPGEDWVVDRRQIRQAKSFPGRQVPPKPVHRVSK